MKFKHSLKVVFAFAFLLFANHSYSQKQRLLAQSTPAGLFIDYKVQPTESFNSIAAVYNISPDTLAEFNNMDYYEGELLAKTLRVPLKQQNFYQKGPLDTTTSTEVLIPIYHLTTSSQTMQQISNRFNKISVATLHKWNGIPKEGIVRGMQILIGFFRARPDQLALFEEPVPFSVAMVEKIPEPKVAKTKTEPKADSTVVAKVELKVVEKPPVVEKPKVEPKAVEKPPVVEMTHIGFFKEVYKPSVPKEKIITGDASIFQSKSGWNDGKYYVLMPKLKPGSIVKISSANKIVYAKVLGELPPMNGNNELVLRLSNSAATQLGVTGDKFPVVVTY